MTPQTRPAPVRENPVRQTPDSPASVPPSSQALADELGRLEATERAARDRARQQELERLRELARYD